MSKHRARTDPGKRPIDLSVPARDASGGDGMPPDGGPGRNRLIHESSPYLLQHAGNPVDWYPWGEEALRRARLEDKPIFLSVGYSTCHWCHVMERESFEDERIAALLNEHYVPVKVDREQRPDLDQVYMLATQILTGSGGWPNSVWLTPDAKPFFAGTYFPPDDRMGRPGFHTLLLRIAEFYRRRRDEVDETARRLGAALAEYAASARAGEQDAPLTDATPDSDLATEAREELARTFDADCGGFGHAPKFPPHGSLRLLTHLADTRVDREALAMVSTTLDAIADGGIHDHLGGGFHRYATDRAWLVPHFEKMLYDNAQLVLAYLDADRLLDRPRYRMVARRACDWVLREMTDPEGGFHSAVDADSEGAEGKFYLWTRAEIVHALGEELGDLACRAYGVRAEGNYRDEVTGTRTGTNILHLPRPLEEVAGEMGMDVAGLRKQLAQARRELLTCRSRRVGPARDDKVLTAWSAMMISALVRAGQVLDDDRYARAARKAAEFLLTLRDEDGRLARSWRRGVVSGPGYLEDYVFLAGALLDLREASGETRWLDEARALTDEAVRRFGDEAGGGFFFTAPEHDTPLARTKDPTDNALPSANAKAVEVLERLAADTGDDGLRRLARRTVEAFSPLARRVPQAAPTLLCAADRLASSGAGGAGAPPDGPDPRPETPDALGAEAVAVGRGVTLRAYTSRASVRPGGRLAVAIRMDVEEGWRVTGPGAGDEAVALSIESPAGLALCEQADPSSPSADAGGRGSRQAGGAPEGMAPGPAWIRGRIDVSSRANPGPGVLVLAVCYRPCSPWRCEPPRTDRLSVPLTIAAGDEAPARHGELFAEAE